MVHWHKRGCPKPIRLLRIRGVSSMTLLERFQVRQPRIAAWRRHLHAHPEPRFVAEKLRSFGLDKVVEGVGQTGVVGAPHGAQKPGSQSIGRRADMDALQIQEATGAKHASRRPDVMHACGHDGHTAMLLGVAEHLAQRRDFVGTPALIFQPSEEGGDGAKAMLDDGLNERFRLGEVYGLYNRPGLAIGEFASRPSELMASADIFQIEIAGQAGNAAKPNQCVDPLLAASHIHLALQSIDSRNVDPSQAVIVSVTQIHGGEADNVIPEAVAICGTVRALNEDGRALAEARLREIAIRTASAYWFELALARCAVHEERTA